ncbi:protein DpdE [Nocardia sp. AB354]|uniref:protein DpdE n=1 Tax=Nocardia sp. AB354 TaxID=3413283 RepID=UPI003C16B986
MGQLVEYAGSAGIGRIGKIADGEARVDFFESVAEPLAYSDQVPIAKLRRVILGTDTRVYRRNPDTGDWLAGRIHTRVGGTYYVRFPNHQYHFPIPEDQLRVRWDRPVADPITVLTAGGHESAYFHDARIPFLRNLVAQRAASANIPALLSSAVELFPHQIRAALTVLADPVQRYLLADEVGLGKTVEAGFIIRQTLIDKHDARICIVAPDLLRRQWIRELRLKFFIDDFCPPAQISFVAHEHPERWAKHHYSDLVVVDEAHRLVHVDGPDESPYRELAGLAHSSTRLLLLSATPIMSHYLTQLGMLHLLAPDLYRWTERDAFEEKYRLRSELADSVFALDSEYTYLLPSAIARIRDLLPATDERFTDLSRHVLDLLDDDDELLAGTDASELKARTEALRAHISEAYRLHRRVIRHRRQTVLHDDPDAEFLPYDVRGRQDPEPILIESEAHDFAQSALADWRAQMWDHLLDNGLEMLKPAYGMVLGILVSRGSALAGDLLDALAWRVERDEDAARRTHLSESERILLTEPEVFDFERAILDDLRSQPGVVVASANHLDDLINAMLPALRRNRRVVLFCGPGTLAGSLVDRLAQRFKSLAVHEHTRRRDMDASDEAVSAWSATAQASNQVLVTDDSAEDGLNLQIADAIIHVRLPWSPNQLEQRLGRVDRYQPPQFGLSTPARQYRLADPDSGASFLEAWARLLTEGFAVFSGSVSTLQDAIANGINDVWIAALEHGPEGLQSKIAAVQKELHTAQQEIDKMDMLEAIHETSTEGRDIAESILAIESDWRGMQDSLLDYVSEKGGIKLRYEVREVGGVSRVVFDPLGSRPLLDPRQWQRAKAQLTLHTVQGAFNRSAALRASDTRLFRAGNQLVDVLAQAIYLDDRGQASAFRRVHRGFQGDPIAYFGFDYLVEADLATALELVKDHPDARTALRRQADRLLPPFTLKVWIEAGAFSPISNEQALGWLNHSYDNRRDQNFNMSNTSELLEVFGGWDRYRETADLAARVAHDHLSEVTDLARRCTQAQEQSRVHVAVAMAQAQTRQAAGHLVGDAESLLTDTAVTSALIEDLSQPSVKVIAATCIIRSGREVRRDSK